MRVLAASAGLLFAVCDTAAAGTALGDGTFVGRNWTINLHLAQAKCRLNPHGDRAAIYREYGFEDWEV